jgi:hypothetical protein
MPHRGIREGNAIVFIDVPAVAHQQPKILRSVAVSHCIDVHAAPTNQVGGMVCKGHAIVKVQFLAVAGHHPGAVVIADGIDAAVAEVSDLRGKVGPGVAIVAVELSPCAADQPGAAIVVNGSDLASPGSQVTRL